MTVKHFKHVGCVTPTSGSRVPVPWRESEDTKCQRNGMPSLKTLRPPSEYHGCPISHLASINQTIIVTCLKNLAELSSHVLLTSRVHLYLTIRQQNNLKLYPFCTSLIFAHQSLPFSPAFQLNLILKAFH